METSKLKTIVGLYDIQPFCKIILPYIMKSKKNDDILKDSPLLIKVQHKISFWLQEDMAIAVKY